MGCPVCGATDACVAVFANTVGTRRLRLVLLPRSLCLLRQMHVDLADVHHPVSDFLSLSGDTWPVTAEAVAKYSLSPERLAQYDRDGYVDDIPILNDAQVERLVHGTVAPAARELCVVGFSGLTNVQI